MAEALDMTGFADRKELRRYVYDGQGFYLGEIHRDHKLSGEAGIADDRAIFIVAGSRAGKGTSLIMPNLLRWQGGAFVIDPKGEAASITALRRASAEKAKGTGTSVRSFLGQNVAILDPLDTVRGPARACRVTYDPMADINIRGDDAAGQIENLVEGIVVPEDGNAAHWSDSAGTLLAGIIEAVKITEPPENHTLPHCRSVILKGFAAIEALLKRARHGELAPAALDLITDIGDDEKGSFKTTLSRQMKWLNDRRMRAHLNNNSGFSLRRAVQENWTVYVCIPPRTIPRFKRWLRAVVNVALDAKMASAFDHEGPQSLFILDEFAALGHFSLIEDAAAYMAGYGLKLVPVVQNLGQLRKHYRDNWETFLANAGAIIGWALNDKETETYFADRLGAVQVYEYSYSASESGKAGLGTLTYDPSRESTSANLAVRERAIRWPSEIHSQGSRTTGRAFVIPADSAGFTIKRRDYHAGTPAGLYDAPAFIKQWERAYAERAKTA